jgi:hypothetical protein
MSMPESKGSVVNSHSSLVQRQSTCPECPEKESIQTKPIADQITPLVQRQVGPEEEEEVKAKFQRQPEEEEEEPIQRQPLEEEEEKIQRQAQEEDEEEPVQAKQGPNQTPAVTSNIETSVNSLKGGGKPLPESTRSYFESHFGADFSQVRVHTDSKASETAKSINAKAFTTEKDVVFSAGQFTPETSSGKRLLAHELAHVIQQGINIRKSRTMNIQRSHTCPPGLEDEILDLKEQIDELPKMSTPERIELEKKLKWRENLASECLGIRTYTSSRQWELQQLKIDAMSERGVIMDLSSDLAKHEPTSCSTRESWDNQRDSHREMLIFILENRVKLLEKEIADLREYLLQFPSTNSAELELLIRYENEWISHMNELRPLYRWQKRRKINDIIKEISDINAWLEELPKVCSPDEPEVDYLLSRRTALEIEQKELVAFLTGNMVEYEQWDPRWGAIRYGQNPRCTNIRQAGCGPTTLAIVLNYLYSEDPELAGSSGNFEIVTPPETVRYAETHGRVCNSGTAGDTMINNISTRWPGFDGRRVTLDEATTILRQGYPIIFLCRSCTGRTRSGRRSHYGGHFMVLRSVDESGNTFSVLDPGRGETRDIETISRRELRTHTNGFWWVYRR